MSNYQVAVAKCQDRCKCCSVDFVWFYYLVLSFLFIDVSITYTLYTANNVHSKSSFTCVQSYPSQQERKCSIKEPKEFTKSVYYQSSMIHWQNPKGTQKILPNLSILNHLNDATTELLIASSKHMAYIIDDIQHNRVSNTAADCKAEAKAKNWSMKLWCGVWNFKAKKKGVGMRVNKAVVS